MNSNYVCMYNLFHGTTDKFSKMILEEKEFKIKKRPNHWLGSGAYFFVNDYEKAKWWARQSCQLIKRKEGLSSISPSILFIEDYKVNREKLCDLDTEQDRYKLKYFLESLEKQKISINADETTSVHEKRAWLIELYVKYYELSASKKTFLKDPLKKYTDIELHGVNNMEVQFCIYDNHTIDYDKMVEIEGD